MKFCPKCGEKNPDHGKFCRYCGSAFPQSENRGNHSANQESKTESTESEGFFNSIKKAFSEIISAQPEPENDTVCPFCEAPNCQPTQKNTTVIKNKGYRWESGCCGMFLLGPFGLLCGMCGIGSKVTVTNELWWTCVKCGKQHISLKDALAKWDAAGKKLMLSSFSNGIFLMFFLWLDIWWLSLMVGICTLVTPIGGMYQIHKDLSEELGSWILEHLTPEQKRTCLTRIGVSTLLIMAIGLLGSPLLAYILGV